MRRISYFRRVAGWVEGQALFPPRPMFALLPSMAERTGMADVPQRDPIQQMIRESVAPPGPAALGAPSPLQPTGISDMPQCHTIRQTIPESEAHPAATDLDTSFVPGLTSMADTTQRDAIRQATLNKKSQPTEAASDRARQLQSVKTTSSETLPATTPRRKANPSRSPPLSANDSTRHLPRRLGPFELKALETPKPIEPPLANAAAPGWLSAPRPIDSTNRVGIPKTLSSFPAESAGIGPTERTLAKQNFREPDHQPIAVPIRVEPPERGQDRNAAGNGAKHTGAAGGTVHIGSLEVKITQSQPPSPPSQPASPVRTVTAISPKPLSREFPTFGVSQAY